MQTKAQCRDWSAVATRRESPCTPHQVAHGADDDSLSVPQFLFIAHGSRAAKAAGNCHVFAIIRCSEASQHVLQHNNGSLLADRHRILDAEGRESEA